MFDATTITVIIDAKMDHELERQARATGHSKPEVVRDVLAEWLQDQDDYQDAVAIAARTDPSSGSADVRRQPGIDGPP